MCAYMNALAHLANLLAAGTQEGTRPMAASPRIDVVLAELRSRASTGTRPRISDDHQLEAVRRFWQTQQISSFRDTYLLSWGLCLPHRPDGDCVLDNRPRLERVLAGADDWMKKPTAYRRCYQGLVRSYFSYAPVVAEEMEVRYSNWRYLRDYLFERNDSIGKQVVVPDWVRTAIDNKHLFTSEPYAPYVDALLWGDSSILEELCERLHIGKASWFLKRLVMAQVKRATQMEDENYLSILPRLLDVLADNEVLRDAGLIRLLNRYVDIPALPLHAQLQDVSVNWWGNPWLPSNETRWGGVTSDARTMVSNWLKAAIIETFFTKLAEDGSADPRRMQFWKRYVNSIDNMEFALGSAARNSAEPDFVALRKKMYGLTCHLDTSGANNAFIMKMGNLVVVEFSGMGNALYGYDVRKGLPFDSKKVLRLPTDADNSLKQKARSVLWESHKDGVGTWSKWENNFETILRRHFGIEPQQAIPAPAKKVRRYPVTTPITEASKPMPPTVKRHYSLDGLKALGKHNGFEIQDNSALGGSLWARTDMANEDVTQTLTSWGFSHKPGKGWWK